MAHSESRFTSVGLKLISVQVQGCIFYNQKSSLKAVHFSHFQTKLFVVFSDGERDRVRSGVPAVTVCPDRPSGQEGLLRDRRLESGLAGGKPDVHLRILPHLFSHPTLLAATHRKSKA